MVTTLVSSLSIRQPSSWKLYNVFISIPSCLKRQLLSINILHALDLISREEHISTNAVKRNPEKVSLVIVIRFDDLEFPDEPTAYGGSHAHRVPDLQALLPSHAVRLAGLQFVGCFGGTDTEETLGTISVHLFYSFHIFNKIRTSHPISCQSQRIQPTLTYPFHAHALSN